MSIEKQLLPDDVIQYQKFKKRLRYKNIIPMVGFKPHNKQKEIIETIQTGHFEVMSLTCGRRFGKTFVISFIGGAELAVPYASMLLMTPTFSNASVMYQEIEKYVNKIGIKIVRKDTKTLTFETELGSTIFVVTPKSVSNALGRKFSLVVFDESQDIPDVVNLWENYIQPAQADYGNDEETGMSVSKTIFIGTARDEENDMYTIIKRSRQKKYREKYINFTYPTSSNPYIPKSYLNNKKATLDPVTFGREYEGKWSKSSKEIIYYSFDRDKHVKSKEWILNKINPDGTFICGIDVGYRDNTAYLIAYVEPFTGIIYVLDEYKESNKSSGEHIKNFREKEAKYVNNTPLRYCDPSAAQLIADWITDYDYLVQAGYNAVNEGVKFVNGKFSHDKLFISEECEELIEQIEEMRWKDNTNDVVRTKKRSHYDLGFAAFRYLIASWELSNTFEITKV